MVWVLWILGPILWRRRIGGRTALHLAIRNEHKAVKCVVTYRDPHGL
jgi:hypothetical protein